MNKLVIVVWNSLKQETYFGRYYRIVHGLEYNKELAIENIILPASIERIYSIG